MDSCLSQNTLLWGNYTVNLKFCSLIILEDKHISFSFSLATPSPHTQSKFLLSLGGPKSTHCLKIFTTLWVLLLRPFHVWVCMRAQSHQPCLTLCDPMGCSPPGFSAHGIAQARILEWVAMPSSRGSSWPKDRTCICLCLLHCSQFLYPLSHLGSPSMSEVISVPYLFSYTTW